MTNARIQFSTSDENEWTRVNPKLKEGNCFGAKEQREIQARCRRCWRYGVCREHGGVGRR